MAGTEVTLSAQGREAVILGVVQDIAWAEKNEGLRKINDRKYVLSLIREVASAFDNGGK